MSLVKSILAVALFTAFSAAQATVAMSTAGATTTYTEDFNGGTSFNAGAHVLDSNKGDDYLWATSMASATWSFTAASPVGVDHHQLLVRSAGRHQWFGHV